MHVDIATRNKRQTKRFAQYSGTFEPQSFEAICEQLHRNPQAIPKSVSNPGVFSTQQ
jgi:hypothetical protein